MISSVSLIGTGILAVDYNIYSLTLGRLISGYGAGFYISIVPTYIKDALPPQFIPPSMALNQIMLCIGILTSYIMAFLLPQSYQNLFNFNGPNQPYNNQWAWRIAIAVLPFCTSIFQLIMFVAVIRIDSPI